MPIANTFQNLILVPDARKLEFTKPYISSAKTIYSMSDYCVSCDYNRKQRHGDMACPFNSLYRNFFERHRPLLQKNP